MIHNVILIDKTDGSVVVRTRFWRIEFTDSDIKEFLAGYKDLMSTQGISSDTPIYVGQNKAFHSPVGDNLLLIFVTDGRDEDRVINHKVRESAGRITTALRGNSMSYIRDNLEDILGELIFTRFKVSFVGAGGVGKSTLLRLLFGKEPAPGGYVPTISVAVDSSETIQFGTFLVTIWDFAGQAVFQDLWGFYFQGTDVIFLVTDSSFRNVMSTKTLLRSIRKEASSTPIFIVANKQDLPESMKADKIKRLLGAPTFPMVATDKTRREEFIRFMLEVSAKTVGIQLPDRPLSEMITVRRKTEELEVPKGGKAPRARPGFENVPYQEDGQVAQKEVATVATEGDPESLEWDESDEIGPSTHAIEEAIIEPGKQPARVLHLLFILQQAESFQIVYYISYTTPDIDPTSVVSLISALDSFSGIDKEPSDDAQRTDALETIEHEGNLVIVEKSPHFVAAIIVTNNNDEDAQRSAMSSALHDIEQDYEDVWSKWDGDISRFETSVFQLLAPFPLRPVNLDYVVRSKPSGRPLPFNNRELGKVIVQVRGAIDGTKTVGGLVRALGIPRDMVIGCLQIMEKYGWVDFKIEIGPTSVLRKLRDVGEDDRKAYGAVVVRFVDLCDGTSTLEDVVHRVGVSLQAMKYVATKLVLDGVLDVVA